MSSGCLGTASSVSSTSPHTSSTSPHSSSTSPQNKLGTLVPNRVFVGGISSSTTESELLQLFSEFGTVKQTKIIADRSGVSKGYGFVTFETEDEARRLQAACESIVLKERRLNIAPAYKKQVTERGYEMASSSANNAGPVFYHNSIPYTYQNGGGMLVAEMQPGCGTTIFTSSSPKVANSISLVYPNSGPTVFLPSPGPSSGTVALQPSPFQFQAGQAEAGQSQSGVLDAGVGWFSTLAYPGTGSCYQAELTGPATAPAAGQRNPTLSYAQESVFPEMWSGQPNPTSKSSSSLQDPLFPEDSKAENPVVFTAIQPQLGYTAIQQPQQGGLFYPSSLLTSQQSYLKCSEAQEQKNPLANSCRPGQQILPPLQHAGAPQQLFLPVNPHLQQQTVQLLNQSINMEITGGEQAAYPTGLSYSLPHMVVPQQEEAGGYITFYSYPQGGLTYPHHLEGGLAYPPHPEGGPGYIGAVQQPSEVSFQSSQLGRNNELNHKEGTEVSAGCQTCESREDAVNPTSKYRRASVDNFNGLNYSNNSGDFFYTNPPTFVFPPQLPPLTPITPSIHPAVGSKTGFIVPKTPNTMTNTQFFHFVQSPPGELTLSPKYLHPKDTSRNKGGELSTLASPREVTPPVVKPHHPAEDCRQSLFNSPFKRFTNFDGIPSINRFPLQQVPPERFARRAAPFNSYFNPRHSFNQQRSGAPQYRAGNQQRRLGEQQQRGGRAGQTGRGLQYPQESMVGFYKAGDRFGQKKKDKVMVHMDPAPLKEGEGELQTPPPTPAKPCLISAEPDLLQGRMKKLDI